MPSREIKVSLGLLFENASFANSNEAPKKSATTVVGDYKIIVPLEDLIDLKAEVERQNKKLEKFPLPVAVSDAQNNILWMNGLLFDLLGEANVKSLSKITGIDEKIPTTEFTEADAFGKKFYVYTSLSTENEDLKIHYFIDVTDKFILEEKHENMRPAVARILIDNYDELVANIGDAEKNLALARLYEAIRAFAEKANGLLIRNERDMFTFVMDNLTLKAE